MKKKKKTEKKTEIIVTPPSKKNTLSFHSKEEKDTPATKISQRYAHQTNNPHFRLISNKPINRSPPPFFLEAK